MKNRSIIILFAVLFIVSCVSAPKKSSSRSVKNQHDRAQMAFDELDGKEPSSRTTGSSGSTPKPEVEKPRQTYSTPPKPVTPPEPEAVTDFSSSRYLTAKGYGDSKPEAIRQAKAELSNIFEARISSDVSSKVRQVTDSMKGSSFNKSIQSRIRVQSDIELEGVQVGEVRREQGEYVAIAALDKYQAREKWGGDVKKIDAKIDIQLNKSNAANSKILKLLPLKKVLNLWVEREVAVSRLRVIGYASEFSSNELKPILQKISTLKSAMIIDVDVSGSKGKALRDTVAEILTDNGFKIGDFESASDVLISGSVSISKVKNNNPRFKFSRATVSLNIIDTASNNQVGQVTENDRGAGLNYDEADHNAVKKVSTKVSAKLIQYFE